MQHNSLEIDVYTHSQLVFDKKQQRSLEEKVALEQQNIHMQK